MNNMYYSLASNPFYSHDFKALVGDYVQQHVKSANAWLSSAWDKTLVTLSTAFPVPGDGMH